MFSSFYILSFHWIDVSIVHQFFSFFYSFVRSFPISWWLFPRARGFHTRQCNVNRSFNSTVCVWVSHDSHTVQPLCRPITLRSLVFVGSLTQSAAVVIAILCSKKEKSMCCHNYQMWILKCEFITTQFLHFCKSQDTVLYRNWYQQKVITFWKLKYYHLLNSHLIKCRYVGDYKSRVWGLQWL